MSHKDEECVRVAAEDVQVEVEPFDFCFHYVKVKFDEEVGYDRDGQSNNEAYLKVAEIAQLVNILQKTDGHVETAEYDANVSEHGLFLGFVNAEA